MTSPIRPRATLHPIVGRFISQGAKMLAHGSRALRNLLPDPMRERDDGDRDFTTTYRESSAEVNPTTVLPHRQTSVVARPNPVTPVERKAPDRVERTAVGKQRARASADAIAVQTKAHADAMIESANNLHFQIDDVTSGRLELTDLLDSFARLLEDIVAFDQHPAQFNIAWQIEHVFGIRRLQSYLPGTAKAIVVLMLKDIPSEPAERETRQQLMDRFLTLLSAFENDATSPEFKRWAGQFALVVVQLRAVNLADVSESFN